jgi:lysyl-tRNA synthetase class I
MAEDKKEPWLNYLALTTVIFAVCATLSTFKGGGFSTRSVMSQSQASDQWAYYQAKSIKSYMYQMQKENLELRLRELPRGAGEQAQSYRDKIDDYARKVEKYEQEKVEIQDKAKALEETRDEAQKHSKAFGMAIIFLQISILLSSIAGLLKKKPVWYVGLATGAVGMLFFADGFFLFL